MAHLDDQNAPKLYTEAEMADKHIMAYLKGQADYRAKHPSLGKPAWFLLALFLTIAAVALSSASYRQGYEAAERKACETNTPQRCL